MRAGQYRKGDNPQAPSSTDRRGSAPSSATAAERKCELDLTAGATAPKLRAALTDEAPAPSSAKRWSDRRAAHSTNQIRRCAYTESNSKMEPIDRKRHAWEALPLVLPLLIVPIVMFLSPRSSCNTGDKLAKT